MKLLSTSRAILSAVSAVILLHSTSTVQATNLRPNAPLESCSISAVSYLQIPGEPPIAGGDEKFGCDDGIGPFIPLHLDNAQKKSLMDLAANGKLNFGSSAIDLRNSKINADGSIAMPPGKAISLIASKNPNNPFQRRQLQSGTGNKHFLLFRVTDKDGLVYSHTAAQMSDNLFGTYGDTMNLKSQLTACSVGKYTVVPGGKLGYNTTALESAPGVIDITIDVSLNNTSSVILNAAMNKAKEMLGNYFGKSTATALTIYTDHTLFSLQKCFQDCGWAAYAAVGSYYQVYQGAYYSHAGVQLHEHGHNLNLAHSGGLDGQTYTDHTCAMGNPLYGDDLGGMCYNPAKNWQSFNPHPTTVISAWYDKQDFITVDTSVAPRSIQMIGIGEYNLQGDGVNVPRKAVVIKVLNNSTTPQYVAFNSAKGSNFQNDEADNLITLVEYSGTGYGASSLKGYISEGQSIATTQGRIVTVQCINTEITPSLACVCVREGTQECPTDCECPSRSPTNAPTTKSPTIKPTTKPTNPPTTRLPTNAPTDKPTRLPTNPPTNKPTRLPTNPPTNKPTRLPTNPPTNKPTAPTRSPTNKPTRKPTPQPTNKPTAKPTNQPTAPTNQPTAAPTTNSQTMAPTTNLPTGSPTGSPTNSSPVSSQPTSSPTQTPTNN